MGEAAEVLLVASPATTYAEYVLVHTRIAVCRVKDGRWGGLVLVGYEDQDEVIKKCRAPLERAWRAGRLED